MRIFSHLPSLLRLSLCLFLSTGLHGGLFFSDWMTSPAESRLANAPVMVSLLPVIDVASPVVAEQAQPVPVAASPNMTSRSKKTVQPRAVQRPQASLPRHAPSKSLLKQPAPVVVDEPNQKLPSAEMVCITPQEVVTDHPLELSDTRQPAIEPVGTDTPFAEASTMAPQTSLQGDVPGLRDEVSSSHALIEAVPNYRSNPLPEYPSLARQRHWQGVVWLMVDVSADGLVDTLQVEKSCGHQVLDRAAQKAVNRWQFSPAKRAGLPVSSQVRIPVRFRLEGS